MPTKKKAKKKKKKARPLNPEFVEFVEQYNEWRVQFGFPVMIASHSLQPLYFKSVESAENHQEPFPTWDELSAGVKVGPTGHGYTLHSAIHLFMPKGPPGECNKVDKTILKLARWGRDATPVDDTSVTNTLNAKDSIL